MTGSGARSVFCARLLTLSQQARTRTRYNASSLRRCVLLSSLRISVPRQRSYVWTIRSHEAAHTPTDTRNVSITFQLLKHLLSSLPCRPVPTRSRRLNYRTSSSFYWCCRHYGHHQQVREIERTWMPTPSSQPSCGSGRSLPTFGPNQPEITAAAAALA